MNLKEFYDSYNSSYELTKKIYVDKLLGQNKSFESMPERTALKKIRGQKEPLFFLRELVLTRLISAIEVYLIDNVKFIFIHNKDVFKTDTKIEFSHRELLSYNNASEIFNKIINKECRELSAGGFEKIVSFYKNKFEIDLGSIKPGKSIFEEYHDRRHLFVHRLGKTDEYYRKKYNIVQKGLSVSEIYITKAFTDIEGFANELYDITLDYVKKSVNEQFNKFKTLSFSFKFKNEPPDFIDENFQFWEIDQLIYLKDILKNKIDHPENKVEIILEGSYEKIVAYFKFVQRIFKRTRKFYDLIKISWPDNPPNRIVVAKPDTPSNMMVVAKKVIKKKRRKVQVLPETLELIKLNLPEQPWDKGIHNKIAEKLNIKKRVVSRGIYDLMEQGIFKKQKDGIII